MATKDDIIRTALDLPANDRGDVIRALVESLDADSPEDPVSVKRAWNTEIARRVEELRRGEVETVDAFDALDRVKANLRRSGNK